MIAKLSSQVLSVVRSEFGRNAIWITAFSAIERIFAVVQTVVIARALGITEYGVYGFLFGTIGFVASVLGLQMGLTATVYVARYRAEEKSKAAAVMAITRGFGWTVALLVVVGTLPFSETLSRALLGSGSYQTPLILSAIFVGATIVSGVQDGIAQGFEIFRTLAKLKIAVTVLTLLSIYPMASQFGLVGVLVALLGGLAVKYALLGRLIYQTRTDTNIPGFGSGVSIRVLVAGFALPSMVVSLGVGFFMWLGMFMLSRQPSGFDQVAIVNTGLQWRGPLLLLALSVGTVAIPAFSRFEGQGDARRSVKLRDELVLANATVALFAVVVLMLASDYILTLYGPEFTVGRLEFCLILLSCVPTVVTNVFMNQMVGAGRMWRVLWLHFPYFVVWAGCIVMLIPKYKATGFAWSLLISAAVLMISTLVRAQWNAARMRRSRQATHAPSPSELR